MAAMSGLVAMSAAISIGMIRGKEPSVETRKLTGFRRNKPGTSCTRSTSVLLIKSLSGSDDCRDEEPIGAGEKCDAGSGALSSVCVSTRNSTVFVWVRSTYSSFSLTFASSSISSSFLNSLSFSSSSSSSSSPSSSIMLWLALKALRAGTAEAEDIVPACVTRRRISKASRSPAPAEEGPAVGTAIIVTDRFRSEPATFEATEC
mmetsp:Transcript_10861/g.19057  ORF Transcript_10861/g.19057 Transcript_10861/m.19057 type:complete len:204 (-) Transcript_10861:187-798(-)